MAGLRRAARAAAAMLCAGVLGACATQSGPRLVAPSCELDYAGRISVVEQGARTHELYGSFELRLHGDTGSLDLSSPLGQVLARARWDAASASVDDGRRLRDFASFEDMTRATLGVRLPREALRDWVRGRPAAHLPWRALPQDGFEQLGWQVHTRMRDGAPRILRLRREVGDTTELLSLVIDRRALPSGDCAATPAATGRAEAP